jgi:hypothetical protein
MTPVIMAASALTRIVIMITGVSDLARHPPPAPQP